MRYADTPFRENPIIKNNLLKHVQGEQMQISTRESYGVTVVDMEGSLDTSTSGDTGDELVRLVKEGNNKKLLLNLEKLDYVSSAGLRAILVAAKLLQHARGELRLCNPNKVVREVLEVSGFNSLLRLHDTEADALATFLDAKKK